MKKAKLMLAAIAVFAIVGGVYASKAKRATDFIYVRAAGTTTCTSKVFGFTLIDNGSPAKATTATSILGQACVLDVPYFVGQ